MSAIALLLVLTLTSCSSWLPPSPMAKGEKEKFFNPSPKGELAAKVLELTNEKGSQSAAYPLSKGTDAFLARINLINAAQDSIDLQYYIYHQDLTGKYLNKQLLLAAQRGVKIRLLLDDLNTDSKDPFLKYLNSFPGVEVRLFNPSPNRSLKPLGFIFNYSELNHRMHNKSFTVDSSLSVMGGRNIGDEYFGASHSLEFGDFDLLLIGQAVKDVGQQFDLYWNSPYSYALEDLDGNFNAKTYEKEKLEAWTKELDSLVAQRADYRKDLETSIVHQFSSKDPKKRKQIPWHWGWGELYYDMPSKVSRSNPKVLMDELRKEILKAKRELFIISPYFIPGEAGVLALEKLAKKGVKIKVVTNSLASTDVVPVYSGYSPYQEDLIKAGIEVYEIKVNPAHKPKSFTGSSNSSLHAKTIIIDKEKTFVGSLNLDPRSVKWNTELGYLFKNKNFSEIVNEKMMEKLKLNAYQIILRNGEIHWRDLESGLVYKKAPDTSWMRRWGNSILKFLPIENQL